MEVSPSFPWKRNIVAAGLLWIAWRFLSTWYFYQNNRDYIVFALAAATAAIVALSTFYSYVKRISKPRLVILVFVILVCLPWADWLQLTTFISREDWSRQLFLQAVFLYAALFILQLVSNVRHQISAHVSLALEFLTRTSFIFAIYVLLFFVFCSAIAVFVYHRTPVVQDSSAHLFQAKIFLTGNLYAPAPPVPDFFSLAWDMLVMKDARWFSMYQPGFALILAAAMLLKLEWFVSPLLGALTLLLWLHYIRRWHSARAAVLFGCLAIFSPFLVLMSSSIMVFTPELFIASATIYLCRRETESAKRSRSVLLFLILMSAMLVRSFSSLPFLIPVLAYTCWNLLRSRRFLTPACILLGVGAGIALLLIYQDKTTGNPFLPGYLLEYPDVGLGFGRHWAGTHTPLKSLENLSNSLLGVNYWLTGWYSGSLFFVLAFIAFARIEKWDIILTLCCCGLATFYFFFYFQDLFFGPRYYYPLAPVILLFVVRSTFYDERLRPTMIALMAISFLLFFPSRFMQFAKKYDVSQTIAGYLKEEVLQARGQNVLVFLDQNVQNFFVNWNDPFLRSNVLICRDLGPRNREAIQAFPDHRPVYFRLDSTIENGNVKSGYHFYSYPDPNPPGYVSQFQLAAAILSAYDYPDRDCFDIAYQDLFNSPRAGEQIQFLRNESQRQFQEPEYKTYFRRALTHAGLLMLVPKKAFDDHGLNWRYAFQATDFRDELKRATYWSNAAGEIGFGLHFQLQKVEQRIDQNRDRTLSDEEILSYLSHKIDILAFGG